MCLTDAEVAGNIVTIPENILLIAFLHGVGVVNDEGLPLVVAFIGDDTDVVVEDHNIAALPLLDGVHILGEDDGVMLEVGTHIGHAAKVDVSVGGINLGVPFGMGVDVGIHQCLQIVARAAQPEGDNIGADTVLVVGIATVIVSTFVDWLGGNISTGAGEDVCLVVDAICILINGAGVGGNMKILIAVGEMRNIIEAVEKRARNAEKKHQQRASQYF